jgi:hypothetical protein
MNFNLFLTYFFSGLYFKLTIVSLTMALSEREQNLLTHANHTELKL